LLGGTTVAKLAGMPFLLTPGLVTRRVTWRVIAAAVLAGAVGAGGGLTGAAQQPTFRSGTQFVPLFTTVTDAQGRLVPDLDRDQFTILDNGKIQNVTVFENETQPFTAIVMLDFSASMTANLDRLKQATEQFLIRMLPADKAQVGAFSDKIQFSGRFTSDRDDLIGALRDLQFGNPTRLYDAIWESIDLLEGVEGRKVVVAFTDGDDTASRRGLGDALDYARAREVMVYSIGLQSEFFNGARVVRSNPDRGLKKLSEETGGGYYELKKTDDLGPTFTRVVQELHSLYTIGFNPTALDGKEHKLEVRLKQPGMAARARRSYVASAERLSSDK
jgi:VWFA-related protein